MKIVRWVVLVVLVVVLIGGALLYISLNSIIRSTVETQASETLTYVGVEPWLVSLLNETRTYRYIVAV
jgi:flagellar basal body-associated protein FliL